MQFLGSLEKPYSVGTNKLIKNGACLITDAMDILEMFPEFLNRKRRRARIKKKKIKAEYREIYSCLNNEFLNIDRIIELTGKNVRDVINILTLMEIDGLVTFDLGKGYKIKEV